MRERSWAGWMRGTEGTLRRLYCERHESVGKLARRYQVTATQMAEILRGLGIKVRSAEEQKQMFCGRLTWAEVLDRKARGETASEIARAADVCVDTVSRRLKRVGVEVKRGRPRKVVFPCQAVESGEKEGADDAK